MSRHKQIRASPLPVKQFVGVRESGLAVGGLSQLGRCACTAGYRIGAVRAGKRAHAYIDRENPNPYQLR